MIPVTIDYLTIFFSTPHVVGMILEKAEMKKATAGTPHVVGMIPKQEEKAAKLAGTPHVVGMIPYLVLLIFRKNSYLRTPHVVGMIPI